MLRLFIALFAALISFPYIFSTVNNIQAVLTIDSIKYIVHGWTSSTRTSADLACSRVILPDVQRECSNQLQQSLETILRLQQQAQARYTRTTQYFWMASVRINTNMGNFVVQYLPLFENRTVVLNRFLDHYNLRSLVAKEMGTQAFFTASAVPMNDLVRRRVLLLTLLLSSALSSLAFSHVATASSSTTSTTTTSFDRMHTLPVVQGTLSSALRIHTPNFMSELGKVRLFLAYLVVVFHAMELTDNTALDPMKPSCNCDVGTFAASVTHVISGVLAHDAVYRNGSEYFLFRRVKRIWPALLALGFFSVLVLGPILLQQSPLSYAFSRSGKRIFWWCISGESLLEFSNPVDNRMSFEVGEILQTSFTPVAVALWSMPQLCLSWIVLAFMHIAEAAHFFPLMFVGCSTLVAAGTSNEIYIAFFFIGAAAASKAESITISFSTANFSTANNNNFLKITKICLLMTFLATIMSNFDDAQSPWCIVNSQLWKIYVVMVTYFGFVWSYRYNNNKETENNPVQKYKMIQKKKLLNKQTKRTRNKTPVRNKVRENVKKNGIRNLKTKESEKKTKKEGLVDYSSNNLVLGTYVFGSGIQAVLATLIKQQYLLGAIPAFFSNLVLSIPMIYMVTILFVFVTTQTKRMTSFFG